MAEPLSLSTDQLAAFVELARQGSIRAALMQTETEFFVQRSRDHHICADPASAKARKCLFSVWRSGQHHTCVDAASAERGRRAAAGGTPAIYSHEMVDDTQVLTSCFAPTFVGCC